jgi:Ca-activated chloride channel family protein
MELAHPFVLLLLPLPPLWAWLNLRSAAQGGSGSWLLRHPHLVTTDANTAPPGPRLPIVLQSLALLLLIAALAQPREVGDWIAPPPEGRDIALVVDTSLTMSIDDFELQNRKATRLAVVKDVLTRFVEARTAERFAIIAFGAEVALLTPPTFDRRHVQAQIARLQAGMAGDNTALGDALGLAIKHVRPQKLRPAVILVSDGEPSNTGDMTPAEAVAVARQLGIAIHTVQVGSDLFAAGRIAPPQKDEEAQPDLADIARLTGGRHWFVRSALEAETMARDIDRLEKTLAPPARQREIREWYLLPLLLAAFCLAAARALVIRRQAT